MVEEGFLDVHAICYVRQPRKDSRKSKAPCNVKIAGKWFLRVEATYKAGFCKVLTTSNIKQQSKDSVTSEPHVIEFCKVQLKFVLNENMAKNLTPQENLTKYFDTPSLVLHSNPVPGITNDSTRQYIFVPHLAIKHLRTFISVRESYIFSGGWQSAYTNYIPCSHLICSLTEQDA